MSEFSRELQLTAEFYLPKFMDSFHKNIPIEWISEAVNQTGRAAIRKRRFPAELLNHGAMQEKTLTG